MSEQSEKLRPAAEWLSGWVACTQYERPVGLGLFVNLLNLSDFSILVLYGGLVYIGGMWLQ